MIKKINDFFKLLNNKKYTTLAGTMSFFFLLSVVPIFYLILILFSKLHVTFDIDFSLFGIPENLSDVLNYIFGHTQEISKGYSLIFIITAMYSSSNLFFQMINSVEIIYMKQKQKTHGRIVSIFILIFFILSIILVLFLIILFQRLTSFLPSIISNFLNLVITSFLIFLILIYLNKYISPIRVYMKDCIKGSMFILLFWVISSYIFLIYLKYFSNQEYFYGNLATFVIFLLWIYLIMLGLIIGIIINYRIQKKAGYYDI